MHLRPAAFPLAGLMVDPDGKDDSRGGTCGSLAAVGCENVRLRLWDFLKLSYRSRYYFDL